MTPIKIPLTNLRAAIFDMDGTMISNMGYHKQAWRTFLGRHDIVLTEANFKQRVSGKMNHHILEWAFGKKLDPESEAAYIEEKEAIYRELYRPDIQEIAGLSRTLATLHERGIRTAIATSAPAKNRDFALDALGLAGAFEFVLGEEHVTHGKPNPEIYLSAAQKLGVTPAQCLVFEDSPPGIEAGKRAGMTVVGILSSHSAEELHRADYVADQYSQIKLV